MQDVAESSQDYEALKNQVAAQTNQIEALNRYVSQLEEALVLARQYRFGPSSEKGTANQILLFNEAETTAQGREEADAGTDEVIPADVENTESEAEIEIDIPAHRRKIKSRKTLPDHLPRVDVIHDLDDADKQCTEHNVALNPAGEKITEQLEIIPASVQVIRHIRKQYTCPCCENGMVIAKRPADPIAKSRATPNTLATIATYKYADGLPLYRQVAMLKRLGIDMDRTTLANWMIKAGGLTQPLINLLQDQLHTERILHMDETRLQVLQEPGKTAQSQSYMWVQASPACSNTPVVLFDYDPSRRGAVPKRLLADYDGALMVDGYEGYDGVCQAQGLIRLGCMAHARRKFKEAQNSAGKNKSVKADYAVKLIGKLYKVEREAKDMSDENRKVYRDTHARPTALKLQEWLQKTLPTVPPKLALGKALRYLHHQWPRLFRYLDDGAYPLDNNHVENAIRPFVIGRKGWMFSSSVAGAKSSANLYSLVETAKANNINPYAYLSAVFAALPNVKSVANVEKLLPWNIELH